MKINRVIVCIIVIDFLMVIAGAQIGQAATLKTRIGGVDSEGQSIDIYVENGSRLKIYVSDKHNISNVIFALSKEESGRLLKSVEKALTDLKKPIKLSKNQSVREEYGTISSGETISISTDRDGQSGDKLIVSACDSSAIHMVHMYLSITEANLLYAHLKNAVKDMK